MNILNWKDLALLAKTRSPYYGELYRGIDAFSTISDLPVVDQVDFWNANSMQDNRVLTGHMTDGIVFKSGGTTGNPKFSIYTRDEWNVFTRFFGEGMSSVGLSPADRVANLFYVGELYASFIFIMKCIESAPTRAIQFPISGATDPAAVLKMIQEFKINVIAGLPTTLMNIAELYAKQPAAYPGIKIEKVLFGGESMYPDQRLRLQEIFKGVSIYSIGYASVDAGLIGYADAGCGIDEHRTFGKATIFEILDEDTLAPITEVGRPGKVVLTNLIRSLMPIIRYPVGDRAVWAEAAGEDRQDRKYTIIGRSEEAARVGPVSVYYEDMRTFLSKMDLGFQITGFQLIIRHFEMKDSLTVRIATPAHAKPGGSLENTIAKEFGIARTMFAEAVADNKIHPLSIEWTEPSEVEINSRTGKLKRVIDLRR